MTTWFGFAIGSNPISRPVTLAASAVTKIIAEDVALENGTPVAVTSISSDKTRVVSNESADAINMVFNLLPSRAARQVEGIRWSANQRERAPDDVAIWQSQRCCRWPEVARWVEVRIGVAAGPRVHHARVESYAIRSPSPWTAIARCKIVP